jgi:iron compound ABC superfamily ATP binding cassette transporter
MVGTGLVALAILSVFYGSAELTSNIASGLIGFLGRTVAGREERRSRQNEQGVLR